MSTASTDDKNRSNASVGVSSSPVVVVTDLISENESLHNSYDFDLVTENSKIYLDSLHLMKLILEIKF